MTLDNLYKEAKKLFEDSEKFAGYSEKKKKWSEIHKEEINDFKTSEATLYKQLWTYLEELKLIRCPGDKRQRIAYINEILNDKKKNVNIEKLVETISCVFTASKSFRDARDSMYYTDKNKYYNGKLDDYFHQSVFNNNYKDYLSGKVRSLAKLLGQITQPTTSCGVSKLKRHWINGIAIAAQSLFLVLEYEDEDEDEDI